MISAPIRAAAPPSAIRRRMSIASPRRAPSSPTGTARRAARRAAPRSSPGAFRSARRSSIVVAPGDENYLRKETPTIAEFFQKNGYSTYFSGKWHLGDKPESYPIEHGFDEMKNFAAYYAGVYAYNDTHKWFHPWFPSYNPEFAKIYDENREPGRMGRRGRPAGQERRHDHLRRFATFDDEQAANAVDYIKAARQRATSRSSWTSTSSRCTTRPMRRRTFAGRSHLGRLLGLADGARRRHRPDHGRDPRRGTQHDRHRDRRQRRLARRLSRCRHDAVPRREGLVRSKAAGACPASCGGRITSRRARSTTR